MEDQNFSTGFSVPASARDTFAAVCRVQDWWASNFEGEAGRPGAVFTVRFGETTGTFKVIEFMPEEKVVWLTIANHLHWAHNKKEWEGTRIVFEIEKKDESTNLKMTHAGLVPGMECYEECNPGWRFFINESLYKLITEGKGVPQSERTVRSLPATP